MNTDLVLIDTSVWINYFNDPESKEARATKALVRTDQAVLTGIVLTELLQGVRTEREGNLLRETFSILPYVEMDREVWTAAGVMLRELRGKGITLPVSDAILAALCLRHHYAIFTLDQHFKQFRGLRLHHA
jgi:predicted nucleic acid-binding protein